MRRLALLLALTAAGAMPPADPPAPAPFVQAVEFPYYLYPANLWERELVWLKNIGVRTVEFSIPWNWHQLRPGEFDFTGRTSPRRDLAGFLKLLRRSGLRAWVRPYGPVPGWLNGGLPAGATAGGAAQRQWIEEIGRLLGPQTVKHGGPVAYVEGRGPGGAFAVDAPAPPGPIEVVSANDPAALVRSREAIAGARGSTVAAAARKALGDDGLLTFASSYGLGHGIGMDVEDVPSIALDSEDVLNAGTALALHIVLKDGSACAIAGRTIIT